MTKIALVGALGRMGKEIVRAIMASDTCTLGAAIEYSECPALGQDMGELAGVGKLNVVLESDLKMAAAHCDVIVDMSLPKATASIVETAKVLKKPLVCGTTGVDEDTLKLFDDASKTIPVIHSKNFSVGIAVLSELAKQAATILGADYDIEIVEKHHRKKIDAPSGTAQILADAMAKDNQSMVYGREGDTGEREDEIGIHAVRGGGIFGEHTVMFIGQHERLELGHVAHTRSLFAQGAVRTASFMATATPGRYTMKDVLGLKN